jgi:glycopeptide antibiotics resistance protein
MPSHLPGEDVRGRGASLKVAVSAVRPGNRSARQKTSAAAPRRAYLFIAAIAWTVFAVYGSLVPLLYRPVAWNDAIERFQNLPPLGFGLGTRADLVANILLFIPLTFFWSGALSRGRGPLARWLTAAVIVPTATVAAMGLEFTQIWFAGRTVSRNDIVAETAGGMIGVVCWLVLGERVVAWVGRYNADRLAKSQVRWWLEAYMLGLLIYSVIPLDLTMSLTELYDKYQRGQVLLIPFAYSYESASSVVYQFFADVMMFVPVGAWLAVSNWHRRIARSPLIGAAVGGVMIAAIVEFAQLLVISRFTDVTDILLGATGATIGAWVVGRVDRSGSRGRAGAAAGQLSRVVPWLVAIVGYSAFVAVGLLFPFRFTGDRRLIHERLDEFLTRLPFLSLYLGNEFNAIKQLLIRVLVFVPLGVLWAFVAHVARLPLVRFLLFSFAMAYAFALALSIELVQVLMPARVADLTEVLLCVVGAAVGLFATARILRARDRE